MRPTQPSFHTTLIRFGTLVLLAFACCSTHAAALRHEEEIALWGELAAPGSEHLKAEGKATGTPASATSSDLVGVIQPGMVAYVPQHPNGTAMLVMPGGGYTKLVAGKEGSEIAAWLNSIGITAFVLKYRLPGEGHARPEDVSLQDAQRALRLIRSRAAEWGLQAQKLGVIGFSAGGHLAALTATSFAQPAYAARDAFDQLSARPDFAVLVYGVLSLNIGQPAASLPAVITRYQPDRLVTRDTSPVFMVAASDDVRVDPLTNLDFYRALRQAGVSAELHLFREGSHGFAISKAVGKPVAAWTQLCREWIASLGMLPR